MLIPHWLYSGAFYGLLGLAGLAVLYYAYRPKQRPDTIPTAKVLGRGSRLRPLLRFVPITCLLGCPFAAWFLNHSSYDVLVVHDDPIEGAYAIRMVRLGEPSYPRAPGNKPSDWGLDHLWVWNDSTQNVRIETFSYGGMSFGNGVPDVIPPGTAVTTYSIDYIGPHEHPPTSLEVEGIEAKLHQTSRSWLTWDPPHS
jgi:hypothetical protein